MTDVFISYAHEDREPVRELVALLESDGYSVWWDREIEIGAEFTDSIDRQLSAANAVVVVWSKHSVASSWVRSEASDALEREILVPIALDGSRIPLPFRGREVAQLIDWPNQRRELELFKFRAAIGKVASASPGAEDEAPKLSLDPLDPTLSIRVATRVARIMGRDDDASVSQPLAFERALADCAIRCAGSGPSPFLLGEFLGRLKSVLGADSIGFRNDAGTLWGDESLAVALSRLAEDTRPVLVSRADPTAPHAELLDAVEADWLVAARQKGIALGVASRSGNAPGPELLERAPRLLELLNVLIGARSSQT